MKRVYSHENANKSELLKLGNYPEMFDGDQDNINFEHVENCALGIC